MQGVRGGNMTSSEKNEMEVEQQISMREEQVLFCPKKRITKVIGQDRERNIQETRMQKIEKLMVLLKELGGKKFFDKLLIKYESGQIVPVKKMQYIRLSRSSPGEERLTSARPEATRRDNR
jgi:hypothetical protein